MLTRGCRVTAVEKDPVLAERLAASLGNPPNLTVVAGDALDWIAQTSKHPNAQAPEREGKRDFSGVLEDSDGKNITVRLEDGSAMVVDKKETSYIKLDDFSF